MNKFKPGEVNKRIKIDIDTAVNCRAGGHFEVIGAFLMTRKQLLSRHFIRLSILILLFVDLCVSTRVGSYLLGIESVFRNRNTPSKINLVVNIVFLWLCDRWTFCALQNSVISEVSSTVYSKVSIIRFNLCKGFAFTNFSYTFI